MSEGRYVAVALLTGTTAADARIAWASADPAAIQAVVRLMHAPAPSSFRIGILQRFLEWWRS